MSDNIKKENRWKRLVITFMRNALLAYMIFSLLRFFLYDEPLFATDQLVIGLAILIAILSMLIYSFRTFLSNERFGKVFRYMMFPILVSLGTYFLLSFVRYLILQDRIFATDIETITFALMIGIFDIISEILGKKIDAVSPRNPKTEAKKPLTYYIDTYVTNATRFHKVMFIIYFLCFLFFISMVVYAAVNWF